MNIVNKVNFSEKKINYLKIFFKIFFLIFNNTYINFLN